MRERPTDGYQERLARALKRGPRTMSVRALAAELAERNPNMRGRSYGGVRVYTEGKVINPRVELLRAMAEVLEVRPEWLALDEGAMTEAEERAQSGMKNATEEALRGPEDRDLYGEVVERFPALRSLDPDIPGLFAMHCLRRLLALFDLGGEDRFDGGEDRFDDLYLEFADMAWEDAWGPLDSWSERLGRQPPIGREGVSRHFRSMIAALDVALSACLPPGTTAKDVERWPPLTTDEEADAKEA